MSSVDDRAMDEWFAREVLPHEAALRRWLNRFARDMDPDDIVQETYAKMAPEFAAIREPRSYMFTVARNAVAETLRRRRIVRIVAIADLDALPVVDEAGENEHALIVREELMLLQAALAALPDKCRRVLTLRKVEGVSQREVAHRLGLSESTVEKHVAAGLRRCAAWFAARDAGRQPAAEPPSTRRFWIKGAKP